jgi:hypothetical protein
MTTQLKNVEQSKTFAVYQSLLAAGFKAKIYSMFQYSYNKNNRFLCILVEEAENNTLKLWNMCSGMEIVLATNAYESRTIFEVRKHRHSAEFITEANWLAYSEKNDSYYIICWGNDTTERYVDVENEENGTSIISDAMKFDSKDAAQTFINEHNYHNCFIRKMSHQ